VDGVIGPPSLEVIAYIAAVHPVYLLVHPHAEEERVLTFTGYNLTVLGSRLDTPREAAYYRHGGIIPYVLRQYLDPRRDHR
jgi:hypothetical protein